MSVLYTIRKQAQSSLRFLNLFYLYKLILFLGIFDCRRDKYENKYQRVE